MATRNARKVATPAVVDLQPVANYRFEGDNAAQRITAFYSVAPLAWNEGSAREATITNLGILLCPLPAKTTSGTWPDNFAYLLDAIRVEYIAARMARALMSDFDMSEALDYMRENVTSYATSTSTSPLKDGQKGRRGVDEQREYDNARKWWSQIGAEVGFTDAKVQKVVKKKTRKAKSELVAAPPTFEALAAGKANSVSPADYSAHMLHALATLLAYDNKHAKKRPTTHGEFAEKLAALHTLAIACGDAFHKRQSEAMQNG